MKKPKLGQHFLADYSYVLKAIQAAEIDEQDAIIEVGPGKGVLTKALLKKARHVIALELDERLANRLHEKLGHNDNLEIRLNDARYVDWSEINTELLQKGYQRVKLVANLPYYLASQMVIHVLAAKQSCNRIVVMVQDEVAKRMCAKPGTKEYSSFSIAVQYYGIPKYITKVPAGAFNPQPRVSSAIIRIDHREQPLVQVSDPNKFFFLVQAMFMHRRKTLRKCMQGIKNVPRQSEWEIALKGVSIDSQRRPETLSIQEIARLFTAIYS
ncbi:ribosomal RNA small subunit methyltransferase A [bacterium]|nr:ribosomal RNA small subunit methyltransferase A [bacterium]